MSSSDLVFGKITESGHHFCNQKKVCNAAAFLGEETKSLLCPTSIRSGLGQLILYGVCTPSSPFMVGSTPKRTWDSSILCPRSVMSKMGVGICHWNFKNLSGQNL